MKRKPRPASSPSQPPPCEWEHNTEADFEALLARTGGVAVLPLGSLESHGPHLPVGSDLLCIRSVMQRVAAREPVAVLPALPYSYVAEATCLPGAIHIDSMLLLPFVESICDEAARNGFRKIVLVHGHGGNYTLHQALSKRILEREKPYAWYSIPPLPDMGAFVSALMESKDIGHACEMETSMNLAAAPEHVRLGRVKGQVYKKAPYPDFGHALTPVDWIGRWPDMVVGDPSKATREKGERILAEWADRLVAYLRAIKADTYTGRAYARFIRDRRDPLAARRRTTRRDSQTP